jgi:hypothetical protein
MNEEIKAPIEVQSVSGSEPVKKSTVNAVPKWEQTAKLGSLQD